MSWLSILIYLVGVIQPLGYLAMWLLIPSMIAVVVCIAVYVMMHIVELESGSEVPDKFWIYYGSFRKVAIWTALIGWVMYIFLPTKQTLILIAGAEIGQRVVQSESVQSIVDPGMDLVKSWIKKESLSMKQELQDQIDKKLKSEPKKDSSKT